MKFLIDAQLPMRLARLLQIAGYDTVHTLDLPQKNATPDTEINLISIDESRVVITKDRDFMDSFQPNFSQNICWVSLPQPNLQILFTG